MAKRSLVKVLLSLAALLSVHLGINRDSPDVELRTAYAQMWKRVARGRKDQANELREAKAAWEQAMASKAQAGRLPSGVKTFRFQSAAILLTYQGIADVTHWQRFVTFLQLRLQAWGVKHWCATLERCRNGRLHIHLMLQFQSAANRSSATFVFNGIHPNVSKNDYLGEGYSGRNPQRSYDRGFFYVYANKLGTVLDDQGEECTVGNYAPAWVEDAGMYTYQVLGKWPENLWKQYKLDSATYDRYLYLSRDGVQSRKRNLDFCKAWKEAQDEQAEIDVVTKRIKSNRAIYKPFPVVPQVIAWLQCFLRDALRFPILILLGPSDSGKTEYAKSLFKHPLELKVGNLQQFPSKMVEFKRGHHDALILDDVRDLDFIVLNQEKLQGKYDGRIEFATTQGGTCFYTKYLFQVPTVVTINYTTKNLHYLRENDFLCRDGNRVVVEWPVGPAQ